jgi:beta-glucosidase
LTTSPEPTRLLPQEPLASADVAIVFVNQPMSEGRDGDLSLPNHQDELVAAVAKANKHTVVVLETGGQVLMPWIDSVDAVVEAWFPGIRGGEAIAEVLTGAVNPSGKLSVTFPRAIADLPHPDIFGMDLYLEMQKKNASLPPGPGSARSPLPAFDGRYEEGLLVGYKWYEARKKTPLFPFGHGLSYTTFAYSAPKAAHPGTINVTFAIKNTGPHQGGEVPQIYTTLPNETGEPPKRLVGWSKTDLKPGELKTVTVAIDPHYFAVYNTAKASWEIVPGDYRILIGGSSTSLPLEQTIHLQGELLKPLLAD